MHNRCESIHVAQWPSVHDVHQLASRHYAFEGRCYVLAAGCVLRKEEMLEGYRSLKVPGDEVHELEGRWRRSLAGLQARPSSAAGPRPYQRVQVVVSGRRRVRHERGDARRGRERRVPLPVRGLRLAQVQRPELGLDEDDVRAAVQDRVELGEVVRDLADALSTRPLAPWLNAR